jgi:hypothetical protein
MTYFARFASAALVVVTYGAITSNAATAAGFPAPVCQVPFGDLAKRTDFDSQCGISGKASSNDAAHAQNRVKNEFCAAGSAIPLPFQSFQDLQGAIDAMPDVTYGGVAVLNQPRSILSSPLPGRAGLGEGRVVQVVAFIQNAHYSDVGNGESVNCNIPGDGNNDIHVPLVEDPQDDSCDSITAEIIPHYRPASITPDVLNGVNRPMRFRGQLFFDASHHPCSQTRRNSPPRRSSWEIHPLYEIDVCKEADVDDCPVGDDTKWTPLQDWVGIKDSDTDD